MTGADGAANVGRDVIVWTEERIPWGAPILIRGRRAILAEEHVANGYLRNRGPWEKEDTCAAGTTVGATLIEGLGNRTLQDLANGPCMNALQIFLPAGKLSMAETLERERRAMRDANSPP